MSQRNLKRAPSREREEEMEVEVQSLIPRSRADSHSNSNSNIKEEHSKDSPPEQHEQEQERQQDQDRDQNQDQNQNQNQDQEKQQKQSNNKKEQSQNENEKEKELGKKEQQEIAVEEDKILHTWHAWSLEQVIKAVGCEGYSDYIDPNNPSNSHGLSSDEAAARLKKDGPNVLTAPKEPWAIIRFLSKFFDPLMLTLVVASALSFVIWGLDTTIYTNLYLAVALLVIVFISSIMTYIQEGRSRAVMTHFIKLMPRRCRVIRDKHEHMIDASELVIGDIVWIRAGDAVPADMRLFAVSELKIESSSLTGESLPVAYDTQGTGEETDINEATNIAWSSTNVVEGEGFGIVFACGDNSRIGIIGNLTHQTGNVQSTLQKELKHFVYILTILAAIQAIVFYAIALIRGKDPLQSLVLCLVVVLVANVPQGLPSTVVSLLTIIGKRLAEENVNVKQLQNVETLGSCTVIASDKTGTITQNKMSVSQLWVDMQCISCEYAKIHMPVAALTNSLAQHVQMPINNKRRGSIGESPRYRRWFSSPNVLYRSNQDLDIQPRRQESDSGDFRSPKYPYQSFGSEAALKVVRTVANLELVAALCNRARFEDEQKLNDHDASQLLNIHNAPGGRSRKYDIGGELSAKMTSDAKRSVIGDPSDKALFFFVNSRQSIELLRYQYPIVFEIPFSSSRKFALVVVQPRGSDKRFILIKGAPEIVLERCTYFQQHGVSYVVNDEFRQTFDEVYQTFAGDGERVLGFAMMEIKSSTDKIREETPESKFENDGNLPNEPKEMQNLDIDNIPTTGYEFLGMISLIDPPKPKVDRAVAECRGAGIRVIMITGDHPLTAAAIARQVGIITQPTKQELAMDQECDENDIAEDMVKSIVVRGKEIDSFTDEDWHRVLSKEEIVFSRTTPEHKLMIVTRLQEMGHVVAVTGDGVNDAPALKKADIGVAMGITGSDVARGAGDIILMDDNFSSIVLGVKEGRVLFDNVMKTTAYTLSHLCPEVLPVLLSIAFDLPIAMTSLPVLAIDTGTELAPAISLAYEKAEDDVMLRRPRDNQKDRLASKRLLAYSYLQIGVIEFLVAWLGFMLVFKYYDVPSNDLLWSSTKYWKDDADPYTLSNGKVLSAHEQMEILSKAQALYWFLVVCCQIIHVYLVRTRTQSIFTHGFFSNMVTNYGAAVEICLLIIFVFVPFVSNDLMGFNHYIPDGLWFLFLLGWGVLICYIEGFKWLKRSGKGGKFGQMLGF